MDDIIPLRHGKQRNKYLMPDAAIFEKFTALDGLTKRKSKYSKRLNWNIETTKLRFKEYLAVINENHIKERHKVLNPLTPEISISQDRQILISKLLYSTKIPEYISNIHFFIYNKLKEDLDNFELADVLFGLEAFIPMLDHDRVIPTFNRHRLTDENYFLDYIELKLMKETIDV